MTRESKLYPDLMKAQCASASSILTTENDNLSDLKDTIAAFVEDTKIKSFAFDQLKAQCENYLDVIDAMIEVNEADIDDYNRLSAAVGSEVLLGDQILSNQEHCLAAEENARRKAENYRSMAATVASTSQGLSSMADVYWEIAKYWNEMAELYREWYEEWKEKENRYDDIEAATSGLFAGSSAIRAVLNRILEGLWDSFNINTGQYSPDVIAVQKQQLDCIKQGDVDTAAGIQALDEYMIESGRFSPQERVAVLNRLAGTEPEKIRSIPVMISKEGREAGRAVMEKLISEYRKTADFRFCQKYAALAEEDRQFVDGIGELEYEEEKKEMFRYLSIGMLHEGYEQTFVIGMMANVAHESGSVGEFESSNYESNMEKKKSYLYVMDNHFDYAGKFSGKNIQTVGMENFKELMENCKKFNEEPYDSSLCAGHDIEKEINKDNKRIAQFGLGMAQITDPARLQHLAECYIEICGERNFPTPDLCAEAEVTLTIREFDGYYKEGDFSKIHDEWKERHGEDNMSLDAALDATGEICTEYEIPVDKKEQAEKRKKDGEILYKTLMGGNEG